MPQTSSGPGREGPGGNAWAIGFTVGTELVVSVFLGYFAGAWADRKLGTQPWLLLVGVLTGISIGLYQVIRLTTGRKDRRP